MPAFKSKEPKPGILERIVAAVSPAPRAMAKAVESVGAFIAAQSNAPPPAPPPTREEKKLTARAQQIAYLKEAGQSPTQIASFMRAWDLNVEATEGFGLHPDMGAALSAMNPRSHQGSEHQANYAGQELERAANATFKR
jgi:hypothetical protein